MKTVGIILAGGSGKRFGTSITKQLMSLNGKPVIQWVVDTFKDSKIFDHIIVVSNHQDIELIKNKIKGVHLVVEGGNTRQESVKIGIDACPVDTDFVIFHDAARPLIKSNDLQIISKHLKMGGVTGLCCVQPIIDSLIKTNEFEVLQEIDRTTHKLCQTPEAFHYQTLKHFYKKSNNSISISGSLLNEVPISTYTLSSNNDKITFPQDLFKIEQLINYNEPIIEQSDIKGKSILLLGASGGIGNAIKNRLLHLGSNVYAPTRQEWDLNTNIVDIKFRNFYDCIIHCAGSYCTDEKPLLVDYDNLMNVNVKSILYILDNAERLFKQGGSFIVIGSAAASYGRKGYTLYSSSKAMVHSIVEAYHETLKEKLDINLNLIAPAKVGTKLQTAFNPKADLSKMIQPDKIAEIVCRYCNVDFSGKIIYLKEGDKNV